jgi:hypothetical protein
MKLVISYLYINDFILYSTDETWTVFSSFAFIPTPLLPFNKITVFLFIACIFSANNYHISMDQ